MASPDPTPPEPSTEPPSPDRVYRSGPGIAGGVLVLALVAWLGIDALVKGEGHAPWLSLASMLLIVPLVLSFSLRPAVFANDDRLRVRNPFRTITLPWAAVALLRSGYSNEVFDQAGAKYQLWAIPVSLRARKRAGRAQAKLTMAQQRSGGAVSSDVRGARPGRQLPGDDATRAAADRTMDDLRELCESRASQPEAQGEPEVRWAFELLAPALAGLILLIVLLSIG
ncbi:PH domain-containing protein [Streptomyces sp. NPDC050560]|uniref:PH domain-containing protein n=1 Tax=Streptomyces sp. NPDC050560 TaxID=3365630 RepID=UPI0037A48FDB